MKIAVLISGKGSTLQNLIQVQKLYNFEVDFVIASKAKATGLDYASAANIGWAVPPREIIFEFLDGRDIDLICLAGYVKKLEVPEKWLGRIINIHPALLPDFGGQGMYGLNVHQAVLDAKVRLSGCTVHYVNNEYDKGAIIARKIVPVLPNDTVNELAERVQQAERELYPIVIQDVLNVLRK